MQGTMNTGWKLETNKDLIEKSYRDENRFSEIVWTTWPEMQKMR